MQYLGLGFFTVSLKQLRKGVPKKSRPTLSPGALQAGRAITLGTLARWAEPKLSVVSKLGDLQIC